MSIEEEVVQVKDIGNMQQNSRKLPKSQEIDAHQGTGSL
jgi:hypothetical protein